MNGQIRRIGYIQAELLLKSKEATLNAVQTFNNPLITFKTETFIVLMVIAWMYLLHAYCRGKGIDYRYYDKKIKRRHFHRTKSGAYKYWELERCLNDTDCPLDSATKNNLRFLVGLRHEIEHHKSTGVDERLTGRYLACCLNYERTITQLFGEKYSLGNALSFTLQFRDVMKVPMSDEALDPLPSNVARYLQEFDAALSDEDFQSPYYAYRLLFVRKLTSKKGQADRAIEFISSDSPLAKTIDQDYWVLKEVERKKYRPSDIVRMMHEEGYLRFSIYNHTQLWKQLDAKNPGKGYGTEVVAGEWLWYDRWLEVVREHCRNNTNLFIAIPNTEVYSVQ
ncbi:DUF3644 domain-containing protein [Chloroflexota bacterium]